MSSEEVQARHEELDHRIRLCRGRGDRVGEAAARAQKAQLHSKAGHWMEGAQELHWAARLAYDGGQVGLHGQYLYGKGLLLSYAGPTLREETYASLRKGAAAARVGGNLPIAHKALRRLVELHEQDGDYAAASHASGELCASLEGQGPSTELVDLLLERVRLLRQARRASGEPEPTEALSDLSAAVGIAERLDDHRRMARSRLLRRIYAGLLGETELQPIFGLLVKHDQMLIGGMPLKRAVLAMRVDEPEAALREAAEERRTSLSSGDPIRYLASCLLMAEAQEMMGDRVGTLETLLTCKATLQDHVGPIAAQPARDMLEALRNRWGEEVVQEALTQYRARVSPA